MRKSIADIRREEIIEAFYSVVVQKGHAKATTREIAEAAGCSPGMLHHYFTNKEQLLVEAVGFSLKKYEADLKENTKKTDTASDRIRYFISWYSDIKEFDFKWAINLTEFRTLARSNPAVSRALRDFFNKVKKFLTAQIQKGIKSREFHEVDAKVTANILLASLEGMTSLWLIDPKTPVTQMGQEIERLFLSYLCDQGQDATEK